MYHHDTNDSLMIRRTTHVLQLSNVKCQFHPACCEKSDNSVPFLPQQPMQPLKN